ncbi:MAG: Maf family protein [Candidatus Thermoplasmatota archaeon]|nr:Maf family protein [Candidatus Thermoplasmatota archaeon]
MRRILLASKSERRISWLKENLEDSDFIFFSSALKSAEIKAPQGFEVSKQVEIVCQSKAENARIENKLSINRRDGNYDAILVSDTMIEDPDDSRLSIGKPKDALAATSNLIRLAGRKHRVWSSTSILLPREVATGKANWGIVNRTSCATVEFSDLGDDEIYELISSESWKGKAGGYDLAGTAGQFCRVVEGEEVTVLGFSPDAVDVLKQSFSK